MSFHDIAHSSGMLEIYSRVANEIDIVSHLAFLERPIRGLDIAGGSGTVGRIIAERIQQDIGELSEEELGQAIEYVNVDSDESVREHSPGRVIIEDAVQIYGLFKEEPKFDFILFVNSNPSIGRLPEGQEMPEFDSFKDVTSPIHHPMKEYFTQIAHARKLYNEIITLSTALLLEGKYIVSGFTNNGAIGNFRKKLKRDGTGLKIEKADRIDIGNDTRELFVHYDAANNNVHPDVMREVTDKDIALLVIGTKGPTNRDRTVTSLNSFLDEYAQCLQTAEAAANYVGFSISSSIA